MTDSSLRPTPRPQSGADITLSYGLTAVVLFFVASAVVSYANTNILRRNAGHVSHTQEVILALDEVLSLMKDAETGQRGYVITGDDRYLAPHTAAVARIEQRLADLERLASNNPSHQAQIMQMKGQIDVKLKELDDTIILRRTQGFDAAREAIVTDRGKAAMDAIRTRIDAMQNDERLIRAQRMAEMEEAYGVAVGSGFLTAVLGVILSGAVAYLVQRTIGARRRQTWLLSGQSGLSQAMIGDPPLDQLGERVLKFFAEYLDAHAGAFFAREAESFRRVATYGVTAAGGAPAGSELGDGLLGQAAKDGRAFLVRDVPEGYLSVASAFGQGKPRHLVIAPFKFDVDVNAVLELGFLHPLGESPTELLENVSESIGVAVRSANYRAHLHNLLEETQRQSEELQAQGEELRVSNEELEEQSRALKESQGRLELQQVELEQTNAQLESHTQLLEGQRDDLARTQSALQRQAQELEQASQYKSNFLANMSHELRTPLNSSLILAKLLADNPQGNLTTEQVRFAESIQSAGNDLLNLINDILDLSKIEAGRMEVRPETVQLPQLVEDLGRLFQPVAAEKGIALLTRIAAECPQTLETDGQRLQQVLKNLLSNALKFTENGQVELSVRPTPDGHIGFAVADTGIGIPRDQQALVFEAFRQADGSTNRKYGGTGLGLSISHELTRLLGGKIDVESEAGRGSTFTVTIPVVFAPAPLPRTTAIADRQTPPPGASSGESRASHGHTAVEAARQSASSPPERTRWIEDDRERLGDRRRVILVIEDDEPFARILYDLVHELDFECLIATTAEDGLATVVHYLPSAVLLDVGLPDHSGLSVLDRLKHDARTRHIPVHVISAGDYSQTALALGAVGYMLKPVKREEVVNALRQIEARMTQTMQRVLVVEDDPLQRDSLCKLLGSQQVETIGVASAAECLGRLKNETFDCMVLDLSLPDASGYSLLERLSAEETYSFPPVIVYTGRELSQEEEQRLRRYSQSIIIKGAKSPERLLDEVTLFLHQIEADLPPEQQKMLELARSRDAALEGRRILVVEDDVRNVFALTSIFEPRGAAVQIARNGREAIEALERSAAERGRQIDLVLMDVMMPEMDGITATREIRKQSRWKNLPIVMLTAKAMKEDQEHCLAAGANDYVAKPLDVEKLLSLVRVWMPR
jgi:signal transduction histidine kinase/DNA-binding response OmpR family regulator/CHASE3 domain sensor protein